MAKFTVEELSKLVAPWSQLIGNNLDSSDFGAGLIENQAELQQLSLPDKIKLAHQLIPAAPIYRRFHLIQLSEVIEQLNQGPSSSEPSEDDFFVILTRVITIAQELNHLLDKNNTQSPRFFLKLPEVKDISAYPETAYFHQMNEQFVDLFQAYAPHQAYINQFFIQNAKAIAVNLVRHIPYGDRPLVYAKIATAFPLEFVRYFDLGLKASYLLKTIFCGLSPDYALANIEAPPLDFPVPFGFDFQISQLDLYAEFPMLVRELLAGKEETIARQLSIVMTPTLRARLEVMEKDCREADAPTSPPMEILNRLDRLCTFSNYYQRFGFLGTLVIYAQPPERIDNAPAEEGCRIL